jgi:hypothetical protein
VRKKIIDKIIGWALASPSPAGVTIYPDLPEDPVRFLLWGQQCRSVKFKDNVLTYHHIDDEVWPETECEHEWSLISRDPSEIFYCDNCAATGPWKIFTFEKAIEVLNSRFGVSVTPEVAGRSGIFNTDPIVSKI